MIRQAGAVLPTVLISDKPAMENRGFYHDATRGRVPTLSYLKQLADTLSFYKSISFSSTSSTAISSTI